MTNAVVFLVRTVSSLKLFLLLGIVIYFLLGIHFLST